MLKKSYDLIMIVGFKVAIVSLYTKKKLKKNRTPLFKLTPGQYKFFSQKLPTGSKNSLKNYIFVLLFNYRNF